MKYTVNPGALAMVLAALRRDAEEGRVVRAEMADELARSVGTLEIAGYIDKFGNFLVHPVPECRAVYFTVEHQNDQP